MADLSCGAKCSKYILLVFNLLVLLAGFALLVVGIWFVANPSAAHYLGIATDDGSLNLVRSAAIIIIVVGGLSLFIGVLGCWGACREKTSCLSCYAAFVIIVIVGEIVAAILAGVYHGKITSQLAATMNHTLQVEYGPNQLETDAWNSMQQDMKCCGVMGPDDWLSSFWYHNMSNVTTPVPKSCCNPRGSEAACYQEALKHTNATIILYVKGCQQGLQDWILSHVALLIGCVVGLLVLELLVVILSCTLKSSLGQKGYEYV